MTSGSIGHGAGDEFLDGLGGRRGQGLGGIVRHVDRYRGSDSHAGDQRMIGGMLIAGRPREIEPRLRRLARGLRHLDGCGKPLLAARADGILDDLCVLEGFLGNMQPAPRGTQREVIAADGKNQLLMGAREGDVGGKGIRPRRRRCVGAPAKVEEKPLDRQGRQELPRIDGELRARREVRRYREGGVLIAGDRLGGDLRQVGALDEADGESRLPGLSQASRVSGLLR